MTALISPQLLETSTHFISTFSYQSTARSCRTDSGSVLIRSHQTDHAPGKPDEKPNRAFPLGYFTQCFHPPSITHDIPQCDRIEGSTSRPYSSPVLVPSLPSAAAKQGAEQTAPLAGCAIRGENEKLVRLSPQTGSFAEIPTVKIREIVSL